MFKIISGFFDEQNNLSDIILCYIVRIKGHEILFKDVHLIKFDEKIKSNFDNSILNLKF